MKNFCVTIIGLVLSLTGFPQSCLPEGITFTTQNQVDSFQIVYPGCFRIEGNVTIGNPDGTDIDSLGGLSVLTSIGGSLRLGGNQHLESLDGLNNLDSIGQDLQLDMKVSDQYSIYWVGNDSLVSLTGLENLNYIGGNLEIINNLQLSSCEIHPFCDYFSNPNGVVSIYDNGPGCSSVVELSNGCGNPMPCLPFGNYILSSQADVDNFQSSFPDCDELQGDLTIFGFYDITNLDSLSSLVSIGSSLSLLDCDLDADLSAFKNLTHVGKHIMIEYNDFVSLSGLKNVTSIGGEIIILGNGNLIDLEGLDNIESGSISSLMIWDNENLSECNVRSICDYLASPNGTIFIQENASGCNYEIEVREACEVGLEENGKSDSRVDIFPNPSTTTITISLPSITSIDNTTLSIYNVNAQQVISRRITEPITVLDIGTLPQGIYFVRISADRAVRVGKFVKTIGK
jgi:hypothetical protein